MPGPSLEDRHAVIGEIYDGALLPRLSEKLLEDVKAITRSSMSIFALHRAGRMDTVLMSGADLRFTPLEAHFCETGQNLFIARAHLAPVGRAVLGQQLLRRDELVGTPFFEEFCKPSGSVHLLGLSLVREPGTFVELSLWRGDDMEAHGDEEFRIGDLIAQHLRRALKFGLEFQATKALASDLRTVIDRLGIGAVLIDTDGRVRFANAEAIALLADRAPLQIMRGTMRARDHADRKRWQEMLGRPAGREGVPSGAAATFGCFDDRTLIVQAIPIAPRTAEVWGLPGRSGLGLLILSSLDRRPKSVAEAARAAFGLTPAEAELAEALAAGENLSEFARRRDRSVTTVKTHLRALFDKIGVRRQPDLVRVLGALTMVRPEG